MKSKTNVFRPKSVLSTPPLLEKSIKTQHAVFTRFFLEELLATQFFFKSQNQYNKKHTS